MNKAQHSPGKWAISNKQPGGTYRIYACGQTIACVVSYIDRDQVSPNTFKAKIQEAKANADLIAAAPDLLTALKYHHEFGLKIHGKSYIGTDTYKDTIAAIAKARGE